MATHSRSIFSAHKATTWKSFGMRTAGGPRVGPTSMLEHTGEGTQHAAEWGPQEVAGSAGIIVTSDSFDLLKLGIPSAAGVLTTTELSGLAASGLWHHTGVRIAEFSFAWAVKQAISATFSWMATPPEGSSGATVAPTPTDSHTFNQGSIAATVTGTALQVQDLEFSQNNNVAAIFSGNGKATGREREPDSIGDGIPTISAKCTVLTPPGDDFEAACGSRVIRLKLIAKNRCATTVKTLTIETPDMIWSAIPGQDLVVGNSGDTMQPWSCTMMQSGDLSDLLTMTQA